MAEGSEQRREDEGEGVTCESVTQRGSVLLFLLQPLKLHYHDWSLSALQRHTHTQCRSSPCPVFVHTQVISSRMRMTGKMCVCTDLLTRVAGPEPLCRGMLMFSKETISQQRKIGAWTNTHKRRAKRGRKGNKGEEEQMYLILQWRISWGQFLIYSNLSQMFVSVYFMVVYWNTKTSSWLDSFNKNVLDRESCVSSDQGQFTWGYIVLQKVFPPLKILHISPQKNYKVQSEKKKTEVVVWMRIQPSLISYPLIKPTTNSNYLQGSLAYETESSWM